MVEEVEERSNITASNGRDIRTSELGRPTWEIRDMMETYGYEVNQGKGVYSGLR